MDKLNKTKELTTTVKLVNDKLNFEGIVEGNPPVSIDYIPPLGDNLGYTSLELFLISLSTCLGSAVLVFLRKMQKTISVFEISAKGYRNDEHPTGFSTILIEIRLKSPNVIDADLEKVMALAEAKYCPVWSMIKGNVTLSVNYKIQKDVVL
jgi:putative redox protein